MSKRAGAYKSEKRKKELMRLKKQKEKRARRTGGPDGVSDSESPEQPILTEAGPITDAAEKETGQ